MDVYKNAYLFGFSIDTRPPYCTGPVSNIFAFAAKVDENGTLKWCQTFGKMHQPSNSIGYSHMYGIIDPTGSFVYAYGTNTVYRLNTSDGSTIWAQNVTQVDTFNSYYYHGWKVDRGNVFHSGSPSAALKQNGDIVISGNRYWLSTNTTASLILLNAVVVSIVVFNESLEISCNRLRFLVDFILEIV